MSDVGFLDDATVPFATSPGTECWEEDLQVSTALIGIYDGKAIFIK